MKWCTVLAISSLSTAIGTGCSATGQRNPWDPAKAAVFVRFAGQPSMSSVADSFDAQNRMTLVSGDSPNGFIAQRCANSSSSADCFPHHTVLWGGDFAGQDVTYASVPLAPGSYTFGLFDQNEGAAYQGWIDVEFGGSVLETLTEWRDTVSEQKQWLGFDNGIRGRFSSTDDKHFKKFMKDLRKIERLERKIDREVKAEIRDAHRKSKVAQATFVEADVLMMPGPSDFFRRSTQPAFTEAELAAVRAGHPITKVVFVADSDQSREKLQRVNELWGTLERRRAVLSEELKRLKNRKRYFQMTDHLHDHGDRFVPNERRIQHVAGMLEGLQRRMVKQREHRHAILFANALFAQTENFDAFNAEQDQFRRELAVLEQEKRRADLRFEAASEDSCRRIKMERERQRIAASITAKERQIEQIGDVKMALTDLRNSTSIIHRQGLARVFTTVVDEGIPSHIADALERESLMTVRLQATDSMFVPARTDVATADRTQVQTASFRN